MYIYIDMVMTSKKQQRSISFGMIFKEWRRTLTHFFNWDFAFPVFLSLFAGLQQLAGCVPEPPAANRPRRGGGGEGAAYDFFDDG